jgi:hypothetical protein
MQSPLGATEMLGSFSSLLAFAFAFGMLIYWSGSFFILYHLMRFGISGQPKKIAIIFLSGSLFLSLVTTLFFAKIII